ncbi:MAG: MarR family winged helix-turn-helix transcriptional regulator [Clostridiales Family XIII bacterium]|nr:MarR family winged helix-turn-helix transcriptional regulator [Clostridiales Family XIII bacterium]
MDYREAARKLMKTMMNSHRMDGNSWDDINRMSKGEMFVLSYLHAHGGTVKAKEIMDFMHISSARATVLFSAMEEKGYIIRVTDTVDRRRIIIELQENGKQFVGAKFNKMVTHIANALESMGEEDATELIRLFPLFINSMCSDKCDGDI